MKYASAVVAAGLVCGLAGVSGAGLCRAQGLPPAQPNRPAPLVLPLPGATPGDINGGVIPANTQVQAQPLALSLSGAIAMGLRNNLAALLSANSTQRARAQHMTALAALLPSVNASAGELRQKINLAAFGFSFPGFPQLVGPFNVFQASAAADVPVLNLSALQSDRASNRLQAAAAADYQETRDMVVLAVANQYLLTVSDESRVQAAQAQLTTAVSALQQAQDMLKAGTTDALTVVRAQVQRDRQRELLTADQNALAKQRLQLARAIGLPSQQEVKLTTAATFTQLQPPSANAAVAEALTTRPDYRAAQAVERAAQLMVASARDERLPTVSLDGNWGTIGHEIGSNHPIFSVGANLELPVFRGGQMRADQLRAETQLRDAQSRLADLRAQIDQQVRSALLDLDSDQAQVNVARDARDLAQRELTLAQDRFRAGVTDNLEVVQAQQTVAESSENYIASLYAYNVAKARLAQALGVAAGEYGKYLGK